MIKTKELRGGQLVNRLKKLSNPLCETSTSQPTPLHQRTQIQGKVIKPHTEPDEFDEELEKIIDELETQLFVQEILDELENDDVLDEKMTKGISKGYTKGRDLVMKLRRGLFRELNDEELNDFMDVLSRSFDMIRR